MALKAIVENLDDIPEAQRDLYVEKDGKFYLDLENDIREHPSVTALSNALSRQKEDNKKIKDKIAELEEKLAKFPDDFDADEYQRLKEAADSDDPDDPENKGKKKKDRDDLQRMHDQKVARMKEEHERALAELKEQLEASDAKIAKLVIDQALEEAMTAQNIEPKFRQAVRALLRGKVKVAEDDNGEPIAVVETELDPEMPVAKYVEEWAGSDEGQVYVSQAKGSGADGNKGSRSGEKNPWAKEHWNLTEQGRILRADRAKAERLAAAAGKRLSL